jgi:hypothetical protein
MEQAVLHILSSNGWRAEYEFGAEILRMTVELVEFIYGVRSMEVRTEYGVVLGYFVRGWGEMQGREDLDGRHVVALGPTWR